MSRVGGDARRNRRSLSKVQLTDVLHRLSKLENQMKELLPGLILSPPRVIVAPQSLTVNEQQTIRLYCNASGNPRPQLSWIKEENGKRVQLNRNTTEMVLNIVTFRDRGRYICFASNMFGTSQDSADIVVSGNYS